MPTLKTFNIAQEKEMIDLYLLHNWGAHKISKKFNVSKTFIANYLKRLNIYHIRQIQTVWTSDMEEQLKILFPSNSNEHCSKLLNVNPHIIYHKAKKMKLKKTVPIRSASELFNTAQITDHAFIYFLGYFWADGHLNKKNKSNALTIQAEDGKEIRHICEKIGYTTYFYNKEHKKRKNIFCFKITCHYLHKFLFDNDYSIKSKASADKILSLIPTDLHYLFFRGFLDGDGSISLSKKNKSSMSFTGAYEQDWHYLEYFLKSLNIQYKIYRTKSSSGNRSSVNICGLLNTIPLLNTIYKNKEPDIGLSRKYKKYLAIIESCKTFINKKGGITFNAAYTKSNKKYVLYIEEQNKLLPTKRFSSKEEAIKEKIILIAKYNTLEYKLRKLINYWDVVT